ncbi:MAG: hypothetical protein E5X11_00825, partial [Mesorhizobium sp.]
MAVFDKGAVNGSMDLARKLIECVAGSLSRQEEDVVVDRVAGTKGFRSRAHGSLIEGIADIGKGDRIAIDVEIDVGRVI